jgi:hypothetical protein
MISILKFKNYNEGWLNFVMHKGLSVSTATIPILQYRQQMTHTRNLNVERAADGETHGMKFLYIHYLGTGDHTSPGTKGLVEGF